MKILNRIVFTGILFIAVALFAIFQINGFSLNFFENPNSGSEDMFEEKYDVIRVVDGDTIILDLEGQKERVRLIGIDAPESALSDENKNVPYGDVSSQFVKDRLEGRKVGVEMDVQERDQYGRLLAYIYLDGGMFNEVLLEEGHARVETFPPNVKYVKEFLELQKEAMENNKGMWGV